MKIRIVLSVIAVMAFSYGIQAQKVKLKNNQVTIDGNFLMDCDYRDYSREFYLLKDREDVVLVTRSDNETPSDFNDDWMTIYIIEFNIKIETTKTRGNKRLILWLLENKVLSKDGVVNKEKAELFFNKYDEQITERTIRSN